MPGKNASNSRVREAAPLPGNAKGDREPQLAGAPPEEFVPVFSAFRRMAADLGESRAALEVIVASSPGVASFNMNEQDIERFMVQDFVMTGSDGSGGPAVAGPGWTSNGASCRSSVSRSGPRRS